MLDQLISTNMPSIQSEALTKIMIPLTHLGDKYLIAFFSAIILGILLYKKEYVKSKIFTLTMGGTVVLTQALKLINQRPRPENMLIAKDGFSFPSGHSALAIAFFGMMIFLFKDKIKNKTLRYTFITTNTLLIILIAFSRLYLNVHWLSDIIAGLTVGLICMLISIWASKKIPYIRKNKLL